MNHRKIRFPIISLFLLLSTHAFAQQREVPIALTPLIGDTLDSVEREEYHLFPRLEGFEYAEFFLKSDSTLRARVGLLRNQILRDTIIDNYSSLTSLRNHITTTDLIKGRSPDYQKLTKEQKLHDLMRASLPTAPPVPEGQLRDPNQTQTFFIPTATTLRAGTGYVGSTELILLSCAYGITDDLMMTVRMNSLGAKYRLVQVGSIVSFAMGMELWGNGPEGGKLLGNTYIPALYGVLSFGGEDNKVNILMGYLSREKHSLYAPRERDLFIFLSGDIRASKTGKFFAEAYLISNAGLYSTMGFRLLFNRFSADLGVLAVVSSEGNYGSSELHFLPALNLFYHF